MKLNFFPFPHFFFFVHRKARKTREIFRPRMWMLGFFPDGPEKNRSLSKAKKTFTRISPTNTLKTSAEFVEWEWGRIFSFLLFLRGKKQPVVWGDGQLRGWRVGWNFFNFTLTPRYFFHTRFHTESGDFPSSFFEKNEKESCVEVRENEDGWLFGGLRHVVRFHHLHSP